MFATRRNYAFNETNVNNAPFAHGIYRLYRNGVLIYIGRAAGLTQTIRSRLQDHQAGRDGPCTRAATAFDYEICRNPAGRERALLIEYRRSHNRLPMCNNRIG